MLVFLVIFLVSFIFAKDSDKFPVIVFLILIHSLNFVGNLIVLKKITYLFLDLSSFFLCFCANYGVAKTIGILFESTELLKFLLLKVHKLRVKLGLDLNFDICIESKVPSLSIVCLIMSLILPFQNIL